MFKKFIARLVNWEDVRGQRKPSAQEIFQRGQKLESELAKEREEQHHRNKQESEWEEVEVPVGQESQSGL